MPEKANIAQAIVRTEDQFREVYFHTNWQKLTAHFSVDKLSFDDVAHFAAAAARQGHHVTLMLNQSKRMHILTLIHQ